ncbi:MAG: chemotaxis protein CheA [Planctomycetota bacterium]
MNDSIERSIDKANALARGSKCTTDSLSTCLQELATELNDFGENALGFVVETAANSCASNTIELATVRLGVAEICTRLLDAIESKQPLDLAGADEVLMPLLFPVDTDETPGDERDSGEQAVLAEAAGSQDSDEETSKTGVMEVCECEDEELLREFLAEASEHMEDAEQLMLVIESQPADSDAINGLFRAVHSVKGSSGVLELKALGEISHLAESALVRAREGEITLSGTTFECALLASDFIKRQVDSLAECLAAKARLQCPRPPASLCEALQSICRTGSCSAAQIETVRQELEAFKDDLPEEERGKGSKKSPTAESMRVDSKRLEQLIDLIGELVIVETAVAKELNERDSLSATSVANRLRKTVRDVQQLSLTLKMVPVGATLQKLNRMVRDLSSRLNKPCRLAIEGGDTEVDKTLLELISDPLVHLVRNSLDHGIESDAQERLRAGKPETATIKIAAEHRAGNIIIRISDDGAGLNRERILSRAIQKELVREGDRLTPQEIDELIFAPGFSTAAEVSDISGRGVGMDVVRKNVESMRGSIRIHSEPGRGTEIELELPLTLSIIDGTVIRIGHRSFIIPTLSVIEQLQASTLEFSRGDDCMLGEFRGRYVVARKLGDILDTPHAATTSHGRVCVVVEAGSRQQIFLVDEICGQQPVVIKPLGGILDAFDFFAGGALLASGEVGFVLDLNAICTSRVGMNFCDLLEE